MKNSQYVLDVKEEEQAFDVKETLRRYLQYWPWFLVAILVALAIGYVYIQYAPDTYATEARVKIKDDSKELEIAQDPMALLEGGPKINLEDEIEILKSYRILSQVVEELNLDVVYYEEQSFTEAEILQPPFNLTKEFINDSLQEAISFQVVLTNNSAEVRGLEETPYSNLEDIGVQMTLTDSIAESENRQESYMVKLLPHKETVLQLRENIVTEPAGDDSQIISLQIKGESPKKNEAILNTLIEKFDRDGIRDRQLVNKRTVDFIDERFVFLSGELDSIEGNKEDFKQSNDLSNIQADTEITLQKKTRAEQEVFTIQTQISLANLLRESLEQESDFSLLPADIGLENSSINSLVSTYNEKVLERNRLMASAGRNNPTVQVLSNQLRETRQNILQSVRVYIDQLQVSLNQLNQQRYQAGSNFSELPQKEKMLRAIERQQTIKENLYILLLEKREEAAINLAVTAPTIKVVDYALTDTEPVSPDEKIVYGASLLGGILLPFLILFIRFSLNTKVNDRTDLERIAPTIPVLAELPTFKKEKIFTKAGSHSLLAESFRIASTNVDYLLPLEESDKGKVVYVTSTVNEEGKSLTSLNLAMAYASMKKKVLLVDADLRKPKLNSKLGVSRDVKGLSNYLHQTDQDWEPCIQKGFDENDCLDIVFSGVIPPNAPRLLSNPAFKKFIEKAKQQYDYIIVDTAPTLLVTDTLLISRYADATVYVVRASQTEKRLLGYAKELKESGKLQNMAFVLNDVDISSGGGYNYGYLYGYANEKADKPWWKRI
ncbi:GumC family protein [Luteirhabdus pelagi]|uniref:GumC family protein n=1 Tax=Luteirhabdus pelagi TaxID=2792783 RepID=UPI00193926D9|nr:tyrosine-protein kinase domain-containing protein [Luteirhabdus pelagi]